MKALILSVLFMSSAVQAGLFQSLASKVEGTYLYDHAVMVIDHSEEAESGWVETMVTDKLVVEKLSRRKIKFAMDTWFTNGHSCYMEGTAKKIAKNKFLHIGEKTFDGDKCRLEIIKDNNGIEFKDIEGHCKWNNCGMRGYIDGTRFDFEDRN